MEPTEMVYDICRHYLADRSDILGPVLFAQVLGYVRSRNISSLASTSSLYDSDLHSHAVLRTLLQVEALFKKCDIFSDEKCAEVGFAAFLESEEICKLTNVRLDSFYDLDPSDRVRKIVERAGHIVARTLGSFGDFLEEIPSLARITNGATVVHPRRVSGGADRLKRTMYATERSHPYLKALSAFWGYSFNFRKIHHNRVELVPKNWKTHRTIACEPEGNSVLQLAFDTFCKRRLRKRLNVDLSDQSRNQRLAYEGSVHGKLCTVDLKAASDRLSLNVVHLLFPREWVDFFLDTRSPCWKDRDGVLHPYHKLSSMGNGYTFTIETLVFAAVCKSLGSKDFSVYGDDIIIETELYEPLVELLSYLGFEVNQEKSHVDRPSYTTWAKGLCGTPQLQGELGISQPVSSTELGDTPPYGEIDAVPEDAIPHAERQGLVSWLSGIVSPRPHSGKPVRSHGCYRESCGSHYAGGVDITPLFLKSLSTKRDIVLLVNNIISFGTPGGSLWDYAQKIISEYKLPLGPPVLDTAACVFIDVSSCYRLKLIRNFPEGKGFGPWQPAFKALLPRAKETRCYDSRALFLWFINRKNTPFESSRHSVGTRKYRSKWVRYRPAMADAVGGTVHLYWWTEMVLARKG
jgi:hypothetical protein